LVGSFSDGTKEDKSKILFPEKLFKSLSFQSSTISKTHFQVDFFFQYQVSKNIFFSKSLILYSFNLPSSKTFIYNDSSLQDSKNP